MIPPEEKVGNIAAASLQAMGKRLEAAQATTRALLHQIGRPTDCSACGAEVIWARHFATDTQTPYNPDGVNHWTTCPQAPLFKMPKKEK